MDRGLCPQQIVAHKAHAQARFKRRPLGVQVVAAQGKAQVLASKALGIVERYATLGGVF